MTALEEKDLKEFVEKIMAMPDLTAEQKAQILMEKGLMIGFNKKPN